MQNALEQDWVFLVANSPEKKPVKDDRIRKGFYAASDGIASLMLAIRSDPNTKRNPRLAKSVERLEKGLVEMLQALSPYNWD